MKFFKSQEEIKAADDKFKAWENRHLGKVAAVAAVGWGVLVAGDAAATAGPLGTVLADVDTAQMVTDVQGFAAGAILVVVAIAALYMAIRLVKRLAK